MVTLLHICALTWKSTGFLSTIMLSNVSTMGKACNALSAIVGNIERGSVKEEENQGETFSTSIRANGGDKLPTRREE